MSISSEKATSEGKRQTHIATTPILN